MAMVKDQMIYGAGRFIALFILATIISVNIPIAVVALNNLTISDISGDTRGGENVVISGKGAYFANKKIIQVSAGNVSSFAIDSEGQVYSWGNNNWSQLGVGEDTGSYYDSPLAVDTSGVLKDKKIVKMSSGDYHSLAIDKEGQIYSWGNNSFGQLGNNLTKKSGSPVKVDTSGVLKDKKIVEVSAKSSYSLALDSEGQVYSWGDNGYGQLGNNSNVNSRVPVKVDNSGGLKDKKIVQLSAGYNHSLVVDTEGQVYGWGNNRFGKLGNGLTSSSRIPVKVDTSDVLKNKKIIQVSGGYSQSLALDSEGHVYSWGYNFHGQLGNNSNVNSSLPVGVDTSSVLKDKKIIQIDTGYNNSMAVSSDGQVYAWGFNERGQLGSGSVEGAYIRTPVKVDTSGVLKNKAVVQIDSGTHHVVAVDSDGKTYSWGHNANGQLGTGTNEGSNVPVNVDFRDKLKRAIVSIKFGDIEVDNFNVIDNNTINLTVPPHESGIVDILITDDSGMTWSMPKAYRYIDNSEGEIISPPEEIPLDEIEAPNTGHGYNEFKGFLTWV